MVKNRWQAYMEVLIKGGKYFLEDAMREREPYLHHLFLGRFQDPPRRSMLRLGKWWFEMLMWRCEEAMLVEKIRGEQQRLGVARRDWVGGGEVKEEKEEEEEEEEEEEHEEEEEEHEEEKQDEKLAIPHRFASASPLSLAWSYGPPSIITLLQRSPSYLYHNQRWGL